MHVDKLARFPRRFQHATRRPRVPFMFGPRCFWWKLDKKRVGHWRFLVLGKPPWHDIFFVCEAVVRNRICVDIFFDDAGMPHVFQTGHTAVRLKVPRVIWINFGLGADSSIALCLIWIPFPHFKEQWRISTSEKGLGQIDRTDRKNAELNAETSWQSNSIWNSKHVETVCVQRAKPKLYWYVFRSQRFCNYGNMSISHWINIFFSSGFGDHVGAQFPPMVLRQVNLLLVLLVCLRLPVPAPRIYFQTPWEYFGTQGAFRA